MSRSLRQISWLVLLFLVAPPIPAQEDEKAGDRPDAEGRKKKEAIQPYDKVITAEAKSDPGLFLVHRVADKLYYEIAAGSLGKECLWVTQVARTQSGHGYGGGTPVGNRVVRWELKDETVLLRDVKFRIRADVEDAVRNAVEATSLEPIIKTFPVKAWGKDKAAVIDVTDLFKGDVPEFSAKRRLDSSGADKERTFIEGVRSYPTNIEAEVTVTYKLRSDEGGGRPTPPAPAPDRRRRPEGARPDPSSGGVTVLLHHSMVLLPAEPMRARRHDDRVGFFNVAFEDYGAQEHEVKNVRHVTRWRLEKKDPAAAVSEPVKPIVFHVGRGVPDRWRAAVKKGIEMWQPAFEAAGFRNAILAKDAPTEAEDPEWNAEDARYSTIQWLPSTIENAMGPHVHDPRTGEILEADIIIYHNVLKLCRDWYFVQASPCDERAQTLPLPDDLMSDLLAYVVAHEVGHSLGFPHNMKASSAFTVEQLRDPEFTAKHGTEASIMDYGRFNYVAQPGDGARLIPRIGPYDFFAIEWGYREHRDARTHAEEKIRLDALVAKQVDNPVYRFGDPNPSEDPSQQTEDLGSDAVRATELGLKNILRVAGYLVKACCKENEDYELLRNMYDELLGQRNRELGHVANVVGGMVRANLRFGHADRQWEPIPSERQREALAFLNQHAFQTPKELLDADILRRLEPDGAADRLVSGQRGLLRSLVADQRVKRMAEHAALFPADAFTPREMMDIVQRGVWTELDRPSVTIDLWRRNLQRAHVEVLAAEVDRKDAATDLPSLCRGQLQAVLDLVRRALPRAADQDTRLHLEDQRVRIDRTLEPRAPKPDEKTAPPAGPSQ